MASADIRGRAIELALAWPGAQRSLRVVRRRSGYPVSPDDGLAIVDLAELFQVATGDTPAPWARIERQRFLVPSAPAEGGLLQAELVQFYAGASDDQPGQVIVRLCPALVNVVLSSIAQVTTTIDRSGSFGRITTLAFSMSAGSLGTLVVSTEPTSDGPITTRVTDYTQPSPETDAPPLVTRTPSPGASRVDWIVEVASASHTSPISITTKAPHGLARHAAVAISGVTGNAAANGTWIIDDVQPTTFTLTGSVGDGDYAGGGTVAVSAYFLVREEQRTLSTVHALANDVLDVSFDTGVVVGGAPDVHIRRVAYTEAHNPDTGDNDRSIAITDRDPPTRGASPFQGGLDAGITYYYAAWDAPGLVAPRWQASSIATGVHGYSERLFAKLPAVHRFYDDPASGPQPGTGLAGSWQLRRFLQVLGPALDQARSLGEALRSLQDVLAARADLLPRLGHLIGWEVDRTQSTQRQRTDILLAPEVYSSAGTVPNIEALVHRATGWTCQVKEFANNVFRTNFVEEIRLWEIWQAPDKPASGPLTLPLVPRPLTTALNDSIDGRPASVADPGVAAVLPLGPAGRRKPPRATAPLDAAQGGR